MAQHIGIVACSAEGAALCYRTICIEGAALMGPHDHPEVSMHTHSLGEYMKCIDRGDWRGVGDLMLSSAGKLAKAGAAFLICPDNTLHQAFPFVEGRSPLPWLHIAAEVADTAAARGFRRLGLTGTRWLVESAVYPDKLAARGIEYARPNADEREEINRIIFDELVCGVCKPEAVAYFQRVMGRMKQEGCDAVVLGCTEIPLIMSDANSPLPTLDSTRLLARAALRRALLDAATAAGVASNDGAERETAMVGRRDVLQGTAAMAAVAIAGPRVNAVPDDGALDLALERFARTGPEYWGGLANHGPMAAEALVAMGRGDAVARWVEGYVGRLDAAPGSRDAIAPDAWQAALGRPERLGDWAEFFRRALRDASWRDILRTWVPRLAPGFVAVATHGAIRTGHAARALGMRETPPRLHELAEGLAYWAGHFLRLPETAAPEGRERPSDAVKALDLLPAGAQRSGGFITQRLSGLNDFAPFRDVASRVAVSGDASAFLSDLTEAFARIYLENATPGKVITFIHAVTGPSAARLLLPYADPAGTRALLRYAWQAAAALYVATGDRPAQPLPLPEPVDAATLVDRAVRNGDEHAIKFAEACLREEALNPRPIYRLAAQDALPRLN